MATGRWQHLVIELVSGDGGNAWTVEPVSRHLAGKDNDLNFDGPREDRMSYLNSLGDDGWAAFSVRFSADSGRVKLSEVYHLRRPHPGDMGRSGVVW